MENSQTATESTHPIPLYKVLEDEYICLYGTLPEEYPWLFLERHLNIENARCLIKKLADAQAPVSQYLGQLLHARISQEEWRALDLQNLSGKEAEKLRSTVLKFLNEQLTSKKFYNEQRFVSVPLTEATRKLAGIATNVGLNGNELCRFNRMLLEETYPQELGKIFGDKADGANASHDTRQNNGSAAACVQSEDGGASDKLNNIRIEALYSLIHSREEKRTALCLSGGGIRSATFNLGVVQGFARHHLLENFDYLSTVSGGGYTGSWLSAWIHRHTEGIAGVTGELARRPQTPLEPDPKPVDHLRNYSNHLSPQTGLLSADFWTMVTVYLRNLFLNWLAFIPLFMAALMIPRIIAALMIPHVYGTLSADSVRGESLLLTILGFVAAGVAIFYIGSNLPSSGKQSASRKSYLLLCLMPLAVSAVSFAVAWPQYLSSTGEPYEHKFMFGRSTLLFCTLFAGMFGLAVYAAARLKRRYNPRCYKWWKAAIFTALAAVTVAFGAIVSGLLIYEVPRLIFIDPKTKARLYVCVAVPLLMTLYALAATIVAGVTSRWTDDDDQEWWARSGAWILIFILMWSIVFPLVIYGPQLLVESLKAVQAGMAKGNFWTAAVKALPVAFGILSGFLTILGGKSAQTSAQSNSVASESKSTLLHTLARAAAPAFFAFMVILIALATDGVIALCLEIWKWYSTTSFPHSPLHAVFNGLHLSFLTNPIAEGFAAAQGLSVHRSAHSDFIATPTPSALFALAILLGALGWVMSIVIDTNKFSLHAFYGNRLKRAYLGASRSKRAGNVFTGFDEADNLQINHLRTTLLRPRSFRDLPRFIGKLNSSRDSFTVRLRERLSAETKKLLDEYDSSICPGDELTKRLMKDLNQLLEGECVYVEGHFPQSQLGKETAQLLRQNPHGESLVLLNRWLMDEAYPDDIKKYVRPRLLHVVNMALNLARGEKLAWQERKAETFTVSPLHSGNYLLGYRRSKDYGNQRGGISLGTAFTISGAAASPNMGYMTSSPLVSFLMAMFNVRLGWWLGNPGAAGSRSFRRAVPKFALGPVVKEALSLADATSKYVYLSDGGHFENLGLYEMVLRRCRYIVVCDASTDPDYTFESLGMAIRKIRIDFGIPIEFHDFDIYSKSPEANEKNKQARYCAIGTIRYSCVDDAGTDGRLIYLKPSLSGNEPRDITNYRQAHAGFPQDFIGDQFFDESQFESYRMLGSHIVEMLCGKEPGRMTMETFVKKAQDYISSSQAGGKAKPRAGYTPPTESIFSGAAPVNWFN